MKTFQQFGIDSTLIAALERQRIIQPTPVQAKTLPEILAGRDMIVKAKTGTGKTLAFLLPIMQRIDPQSSGIQGLIVAPTRELALQITREAKRFSPNEALGILAVYGGQDIQSQLRKLKGHIHLVIATPGRLLDHLDRGSLSLDVLKVLVLDEADQMLQFGFRIEIEDLIKRTPSDRQFLCFSATMDAKVKKLAYRFMTQPLEVAADEEQVPITQIRQKIIVTTDRWKQEALLKELDETNPFLAIIFCRTRRRADKLEYEMSVRKYACNKLHGGMTQKAREHVLQAFRDVKFQFLIATDVAARGLDITHVDHIYNYDTPESVEDYIHRIGRTGRMDKKGLATTFVTPKDQALIEAIEKRLDIRLPKSEHRHPAHREPRKRR